jgi:hypothetical protein
VPKIQRETPIRLQVSVRVLSMGIGMAIANRSSGGQV